MGSRSLGLGLLGSFDVEPDGLMASCERCFGAAGGMA